MTEAYVPVADYGKYYGEVVDQIGSVSQVCPLRNSINLCLILIGETIIIDLSGSRVQGGKVEMSLGYLEWVSIVRKQTEEHFSDHIWPYTRCP